jgi:serine/threonine-protein kinase
MTPEQWEQTKRLFLAALEREPALRSDFLAEACAGDAALRREVESLLVAHEGVDDFIEAPAADVAAALLSESQTGLVAGQMVGPFRVEKVVARGGMGEVYLAEDTRLGRRVALKFLPPQFTSDADRVRRFEREARAASALNHPHIVTVYEIGHADSLHYIAAEFVEGETLRGHLTNARMTLGEVLDVATQIASALQAAHKAGVVHRDIKPENVIVRPDGYVKVLDFGIAKLTGRGSASEEMNSEAPTRALTSTSPGVVMGTAHYMSPEQARGEGVDARTDVWSLGVVLYEMVSGRAPFVGETPSHILVSIMEGEPPPLSLDEEVPPGLERIISKALRKEREERYRTAGEMADDLKNLRETLPVESRLKRLRRSDEGGGAPAAEGGGHTSLKAARASATDTSGSARAHLTTSAQFVIDGIRRHRGGAVFASTTALVLLAALLYFFNFANRGGAAIESVAVLPLVNAGGDPEAEYLSDGVSESLINSLAQLPGLKVIARSSSFKYKGKEVDSREVARALGVAAILTGRVTRRGDDLSISVELVDARDNTHIWGEQYNRKESDLPQVQAELSRKIAEALRPRLTAGEQQQLAKGETVNLQAYELLLKARFTWSKGGTENRKTALSYYQQATEVDPTYALAYAEMVFSYIGLITNNELKPKEFMPKAEAAARKALELDEGLAEAHLAVANVKRADWDWTATERELKRALELNPNLVRAHIAYAAYLRIHGRREECVAEWNRIRELDPLSPAAKQAVLAGPVIFRQNEQALAIAKEMLEQDKSNPDAHTDVGRLYERLGRYQEAIAAYQEAIRLGDDSPDTQTLLGAAYARGGEREKARAILKRLETGQEYISPANLAILHVALGERDQAFAQLEAAYAAHAQDLIWLRGEWEFDELHSDPRFDDLVRRIGLE